MKRNEYAGTAGVSGGAGGTGLGQVRYFSSLPNANWAGKDQYLSPAKFPALVSAGIIVPKATNFTGSRTVNAQTTVQNRIGRGAAAGAGYLVQNYHYGPGNPVQLLIRRMSDPADTKAAYVYSDTLAAGAKPTCCYTNDRFLAIGANGASSWIYESTNVIWGSGSGTPESMGFTRKNSTWGPVGIVWGEAGIYVGFSDSEVRISTGDWEIWTAKTIPGLTGNIADLLFDGQRFVLFSTTGGVWTALPDGETWTKLVTTGLPTADVRFAAFDDMGTYALITGSSVYVSTDRLSWLDRGKPANATGITHITGRGGVFMLSTTSNTAATTKFYTSNNGFSAFDAVPITEGNGGSYHNAQVMCGFMDGGNYLFQQLHVVEGGTYAFMHTGKLGCAPNLSAPLVLDGVSYTQFMRIK